MNECNCDNCSRPDNGSNPYYFLNFNTVTASFNVTGSAVNALGTGLFPSAVRIATLDLKSNAGLIALSLSSTITNFTANSTCGIFVALDQGLVCSVDGLSRHFVCHLCGANSAAGLPSSSARTTMVPMGGNTQYKINSGQLIAVYASAPNDATALLAGALTAYYVPST